MIKLEKKTLLPKPFNGMNWHRLPEYIKRVIQDIQALQISKTVVGAFDSFTELSQGDPLIAGKTYRVYLAPGDDFSNVGYITNDTDFIATGTTPSIWANYSTVQIHTPFTIYYNDLDPNIYVESVGGVNYNIKVTNNGFIEDKTFPNIISGSSINVLDTNTIYYNAQNNPKYFKIEVYV